MAVKKIFDDLFFLFQPNENSIFKKSKKNYSTKLTDSKKLTITHLKNAYFSLKNLSISFSKLKKDTIFAPAIKEIS